MLNFNPFSEYSVTNYKQYKQVPFLETKCIKELKKMIEGQIRDNFKFPQRHLILGERGLGKSSTIFFIRDILEKSNKLNIFVFSRLISGMEEFKNETGVEFNEISKEKMVMLIDFPDTIIRSNFIRFLDFVWLLMTHKNYENINLIFSLNISHYEYSDGISEVLGKFFPQRMDRMDFEETCALIKERLIMAGDVSFFDDDVYDLIFEYSKGIPRNTICACKKLTDIYFKKNVKYKEAKKILREDYSDQIINDRVEDHQERIILKNVYNLIKNDFGGMVLKQADLINKAKETVYIGRDKLRKYLKKLNEYGLINIKWGGENNSSKIIKIK